MNSRSFISTLDLKNFLRKTFFNYHTFVIPVHTRPKYRRKITKREASFHFMAFKCKISITSSNIAFEQNWKNKNNLTQTIHQKKKKVTKKKKNLFYRTETRAFVQAEKKKEKKRGKKETREQRNANRMQRNSVKIDWEVAVVNLVERKTTTRCVIDVKHSLYRSQRHFPLFFSSHFFFFLFLFSRQKRG